MYDIVYMYILSSTDIYYIYIYLDGRGVSCLMTISCVKWTQTLRVITKQKDISNISLFTNKSLQEMANLLLNNRKRVVFYLRFQYFDRLVIPILILWFQ